MPIIIPVTVDIPATKTISYEFLRDELTRYAQNVVNSEEQLEVMSATELEAKSLSVDEVRTRLGEFIHERFQSRSI